jgi:NADH:ubiquinone oxidoreductase subunit 2 (subunit N)
LFVKFFLLIVGVLSATDQLIFFVVKSLLLGIAILTFLGGAFLSSNTFKLKRFLAFLSTGHLI